MFDTISKWDVSRRTREIFSIDRLILTSRVYASVGLFIYLWPNQQEYPTQYYATARQTSDWHELIHDPVCTNRPTSLDTPKWHSDRWLRSVFTCQAALLPHVSMLEMAFETAMPVESVVSVLEDLLSHRSGRGIILECKTSLIVCFSQLILFGIERQAHVIFIAESNITFHHLFVREWNTGFETLPYPRAAGDFAIYTQQDVLDSINYAVHRVKIRLRGICELSVFCLVQQLDGYLLGPIRFQGSFQLNIVFASRYDDRCTSCSTMSQSFQKLCYRPEFTHVYLRHPSGRQWVESAIIRHRLELSLECFRFNASDTFDVEQYLFKTHNETINYCR